MTTKTIEDALAGIERMMESVNAGCDSSDTNDNEEAYDLFSSAMEAGFRRASEVAQGFKVIILDFISPGEPDEFDSVQHLAVCRTWDEVDEAIKGELESIGGEDNATFTLTEREGPMKTKHWAVEAEGGSWDGFYLARELPL